MKRLITTYLLLWLAGICFSTEIQILKKDAYCPLCSPPTLGASLLQTSNNQSGSIDLSWTRGNGDAVLVVARLNSTTRVAPSEGVCYTVNSVFGSGSGTQITGIGNYVVANGNINSITVSGLTACKRYTIDLYEFNSSGICYISTPYSESFIADGQCAHTYYFENSLSSADGGGLLSENLACGATSGNYSTQAITTREGPCANLEVFNFNDGGGIRYPNNFITNEYTINLFCKFNTLSGYVRVIDFSNSASDNGIYIYNDDLNFYPNGNVGTLNYFSANLYYLFTFVRTEIDKKIKVYVNGQLFSNYTDNSNQYVLATTSSPLVFFRDDNVFSCETSAGSVRYLSVSKTTLIDNEVADIWNSICDVIFPVELSDISYQCSENSVSIKWTSNSEINNSFYTIEKSNDGIHWNADQYIPGNGNSNTPIHYAVVSNYNEKERYFRLLQTDFDGTSEILNTQFVDCKNSSNIDIQVLNKRVMVNGIEEKTNIYVCNSMGQILYSSSTDKDAVIDLSSHNTGVYHLLCGNETFKIFLP